MNYPHFSSMESEAKKIKESLQHAKWKWLNVNHARNAYSVTVFFSYFFHIFFTLMWPGEYFWNLCTLDCTSRTKNESRWLGCKHNSSTSDVYETYIGKANLCLQLYTLTSIIYMHTYFQFYIYIYIYTTGDSYKCLYVCNCFSFYLHSIVFSWNFINFFVRKVSSLACKVKTYCERSHLVFSVFL